MLRTKEQDELYHQRHNLIVLAQLTRNQFAVDYWVGHIRTLCDLPIFRREVKQLYNRIITETTNYNNTFCDILKRASKQVDVYEMMLDSTCEFHGDLKRMVYLYEQAISRAIQRRGIPYADFMCRMSTSQQLLNACAMSCGLEAKMQPSVRQMITYGTPCVEMPFVTEENAESVLPSSMGHFARLAGKMNLAILAAVGNPGDITVNSKDDPEVVRSIDICAQNIIHAMMQYETIEAMYLDNGHTIQEAREIVAKEKEKSLKREAKKQYKQTKNKSNEN